MDRPLDIAVCESEFAVRVVIEVAPEIKALGLALDAALIVFVFTVGRHRHRRGKREFRPQKPFRTVPDACNTNRGEYFYFLQIRHGGLLSQRKFWTGSPLP